MRLLAPNLLHVPKYAFNFCLITFLPIAAQVLTKLSHISRLVDDIMVFGMSNANKYN
jgi:hypothetical protein